MLTDDLNVAGFVETGDLRLKYPEWRNANYSAPCEFNCPTYIPTQKRIALLRQGKIKEAMELVLDYSPFPASVCGQVCPNLCMDECSRRYIDLPVKIDGLGKLSAEVAAKNVRRRKLKNSCRGLRCCWPCSLLPAKTYGLPCRSI